MVTIKRHVLNRIFHKQPNRFQWNIIKELIAIQDAIQIITR